LLIILYPGGKRNANSKAAILLTFRLCCGSGSGLLFCPRIWVGKNLDRIRDKHPVSYFQELNNYFRVKIFKFFVADPDPGSGFLFTLDPG
jgi:hypothetical protein